VSIQLDHIGYLGPDIDPMIKVFQTLGFKVTGPSVLHTSGQGSAPGDAVQTSAHVMFRDSYIELTSVSPCPPGYHLEPYMGSETAIRLLVLNTSNADETRAALKQAGHPVSTVQQASRELSYGGGDTAHFSWFSVSGDPLPGTLTAWVEHQSRQAVFRQKVMSHPNTVTGISALIHQAGEFPAFLVDADRGDVPVKASNGSNRASAFFTGVEMTAGDIRVCASCLRENRVPFELRDDVIEVAASEAAGARLYIRPDQ